MKTNQIMESVDRELGGKVIPQRTKDGYFALTPIIALINMQRLQKDLTPIDFYQFAAIDNVAEFMKELENEVGMPIYYKATKSSKGWVHPFLAIKLLTYYNPKFEIQVYKWLFDYLLQNRISSCDSFNKMAGVLFRKSVNKAKFPRAISILSAQIKQLIGVDDWNKATQEQLKRRDELQNLIADLATSLSDFDQAIKLSMQVYKDKYIENPQIEAQINENTL